jgi:hypothetical protein
MSLQKALAQNGPKNCATQGKSLKLCIPLGSGGGSNYDNS